MEPCNDPKRQFFWIADPEPKTAVMERLTPEL